MHARGLLIAACLLAIACTRSAAPEAARALRPPPVASAAPFTAGQALFHRDPRWVGADSAYSIDLGGHRVLWLFADTFVDAAADGLRTNGPNAFIRNSVAIQGTRSGGDLDDGYDAAQAGMEFTWRVGHDGRPRSFFWDVDEPAHWVWPLHGARVHGSALLLFRMHVHATSDGLGFRLSGWDAVAIDTPSASPSAWEPRVVQPETSTHDVLLGASALVHESHLYVYGAKNDDREHAVYLARFPTSVFGGLPEGALADPEWFCGARGFVKQSAGAVPEPLFRDGQTELSVHHDARLGLFVEIQMRGLFLSAPDTALAYRTAPRPEGPWGELVPFHRPAEATRPDAAQLVAYAGKAHPEQHAPGLVVSYVAHDLSSPIPADALYYPQLVTLHWR